MPNDCRREINSPRLPPTVKDFGVAGAILVGNTLYISGQTPLDANFNVIGATFEEQVRVVFDAITAVLEEAGFTWNNLVKLTAYVDAGVGRPAIRIYCDVLKEYLARYSSNTAVAHTYMLMPVMQVPGMLLEVEGIAVGGMNPPTSA